VARDPRRSIQAPDREIELQVDKLEIISRCPPLPFQLDEENVDETLRLRNRWLDLRRDRLQKNIALRARCRRDPSRDGGRRLPRHPDAHPRQADARRSARLPRAGAPATGPLLRAAAVAAALQADPDGAGFDRYYQIAVCFRDEDLRADRLQELTQLDAEVAFPDLDELFSLMERMIQAVWQECIGVELEAPFLRMSWDEAMARYGSDKPTWLRSRDRGCH